MKKSLLLTTLVFTSSYYPITAYAAGVAGELEEVRITGKQGQYGLQGEAEAASVGTVLSDQIKHRPLLRPAELLETIPGMVVTQHSGAGKANQYFLRGFNLDHGTDFSNHIEGIPINKVTHGHGQGYTDLNMLIPELVSRMVYKKGPYYASEGDFSSSGSARIHYVNSLDFNKVSLTAGEDGYHRALAYGGFKGLGGDITYAVENMKNDGPWENEDDYKKDNLSLKYYRGDKKSGFSVTGMYYDASWNATDQIPQSFVKSGAVGRYASGDSTSGGETRRTAVSSKVWGEMTEALRYEASAYLEDYDLSLSTNATYFLNDPVRGDQFTQFDDRKHYGASLVLNHRVNDIHSLEYGASIRLDDISDVGVGLSETRTIYQMESQSSVDELAWAAYTSINSQWNDWFATIVGVRYDHFDVDVDAKTLNDTDGSEDDDLTSSKLSLRFGPFNETEFFINYGQGYHSNDARGVVKDSEVPLISETEGYELGMRTAVIDNLSLSVVLFHLELDSELIFVGDDGTTEPKGATERTGLEIGAYYKPVDWFVLDLDYANSDARFKVDEDGGDRVPDSIEEVISLGASVDFESGLYGGLRMRYFGPRNLDTVGEVKSKSTSLLNANVGYHFDNGLNIGLEVINLLDSEKDDITYYYESRFQVDGILQAPREDFHSHPMVPRTFRATMAYKF